MVEIVEWAGYKNYSIGGGQWGQSGSPESPEGLPLFPLANRSARHMGPSLGAGTLTRHQGWEVRGKNAGPWNLLMQEFCSQVPVRE